MRFLTDENFPQASVHRLREAGHDVFDVTERMPGATDLEVLGCAAEGARILLTFDRDYGELIYRAQRLWRLGFGGAVHGDQLARHPAKTSAIMTDTRRGRA
jgi:predicted nuclease of predicted toxin-antitoxin system